MLRAVTSCGIVWLALLSTGCVFIMPDRIHYTLEPLKDEPRSECSPVDRGDGGVEIVGLGLSGGGSRAAVFGAAGLEALWEHGLLSQATHLSSVSGGSFASSYFAANHPACEDEACWREFFSELKEAMRYNYFDRMELRQIYKPNRFLSPTRRTLSLQEVIDGRFLHHKTFGDLAKQAADAPDGLARPALLINATSYDEGRRFVFSNLCFPEGVEDVRNPCDPLTQPALRARTFSRAGCPRTVPDDFKLSLAVATSAAFPPLIGPVAFEVPTTCEDGETEWWHLGDGGIIDNTGVDTLEEIVLLEARDGRSTLERVLIVSLDSGRTVTTEQMLRTKSLRLFTRNPGRVAEMTTPRGNAYHDLVWERTKRDLAARGTLFETISIRYTMADLDRWPESCGEDEAGDADATRRAILARLEAVPTDLEITECHADLVEMAAHKAVHDALNREVRRLRAEGIDVREFRHAR
jgi:predicted acylesterase/phospholipase RssA